MGHGTLAASIVIAPALFPRDRTAIVELFRSYQASLSVDLCFQGFEQEIAGLPGDYAGPTGRLLLARLDGEPAGCVALRRHGPEVGEMKRLYVGAAARGHRIGAQLIDAIIAEARAIGYRRLNLDTLPEMAEAQSLYERRGFRSIEAYTFNPVPGVKYLGLEL